MKHPRFRVATCEGYALTVSGAGGHREPGLSATVCDTMHLWAEVRTYRSEDRVFRQGLNATRGKEATLQDAEDHAAYLNRAYARELHAERVRAGRAARANGRAGG